MNNPPLFFYHSGQQLLVMPGPDGKPFGIPTRAIRAVRNPDGTPFWKNVDDRTLLDVLPRFDAPAAKDKGPGVIAPTAENMAAAAFTHAVERSKKNSR